MPKCQALSLKFTSQINFELDSKTSLMLTGNHSGNHIRCTCMHCNQHITGLPPFRYDYFVQQQGVKESCCIVFAHHRSNNYDPERPTLRKYHDPLGARSRTIFSKLSYCTFTISIFKVLSYLEKMFMAYTQSIRIGCSEK